MLRLIRKTRVRSWADKTDRQTNRQIVAPRRNNDSDNDNNDCDDDDGENDEDDGDNVSMMATS